MQSESIPIPTEPMVLSSNHQTRYLPALIYIAKILMQEPLHLFVRGQEQPNGQWYLAHIFKIVKICPKCATKKKY